MSGELSSRKGRNTKGFKPIKKGVFRFMKKNVMMRAASTLLVAVLLTTCAISGTFAKYTTSASSIDTARVAKWGVVVTATGTTFAKSYATNDSATVTTITNSVVSSETDKNVLAPGTSGTLAKATITGTPEVAVKVSYSATVDFGDNWKDKDDVYYCPIFVTINGTKLSGLDYTNIDGFETAIKNTIEAYSKTYDPNTDLASESVKNDSLSVSWKWDFFGATGTDNRKQEDEKDTALGDAAADDDTTNDPTISLTITTTVTQID